MHARLFPGQYLPGVCMHGLTTGFASPTWVTVFKFVFCRGRLAGFRFLLRAAEGPVPGLVAGLRPRQLRRLAAAGVVTRTSGSRHKVQELNKAGNRELLSLPSITATMECIASVFTGVLLRVGGCLLPAVLGFLFSKCTFTKQLLARPVLLACWFTTALMTVAVELALRDRGAGGPRPVVVLMFFLGTRFCVYGVTGGIATGKSTFSHCLRMSAGFTVIDADVIAREILMPGRAAYRKVVSLFGPSILVPGTKEVDRNVLRELIFADHRARHQVSRITHFYIIAEMIVQLVRYRVFLLRRRVALDVPLLFETRMDWLCAPVFVVCVDEKTQMERLKKRDGLKCSADTLRRMALSQLPLEEKCRRADIVVDNTGSLDNLEHQVLRYFVL